MLSIFRNKTQELEEIKKWRRKIAHDMRSPLSVLQGYLEMKKDGNSSDEDESDYLHALKVSLEKLTRIADEISGKEKESQKVLETAVAANQKMAFSSNSRNGSILVVDDDEGICYQWRHILKKKGYHVLEARSGEELLQMEIDFDRIQSAIVDYHFEGSQLNGLDIIEYLKRKKMKRIYLCTANYQEEDVQKKAKKLEVTRLLGKPINMFALPEEF